MGVNSLPKTVTRQRRDCDLNSGPSVPEFSTLNHSATEPPLLMQSIELHMQRWPKTHRQSKWDQIFHEAVLRRF